MLCDERTALAVGRIANYEDMLAKEERAAIEKAVAKRRREFSTGRMLVKRALEISGMLQQPSYILQGADRGPIWPSGVVGSISHTDTVGLAVVAPASDVIGIGIDVEAANRVSSKLAKLILTDREQRQVGRSSKAVRDLSFLFSAKEAVFKAVNPSVGLMIDYRDCELSWSAGSPSFAARYVGPDAANRVLDAGQGYCVDFIDNVVTGYMISY